jgi:chlorobactene glucosyltransferase
VSLLALMAALLPWMALGAFLAFAIREPRPLPGEPDAEAAFPGEPDVAAAGIAGPGTPSGADAGPDADPLVSIIVPARNEERNIGRCLASLTALEGVDFEILVVDDRSTDATADLVRTHSTGHARAIRLVEGAELPAGWFGKPWACRQGAEQARGRMLLFTDADTRHDPRLLARALAALDEDRVDALSLLGEQEMVTFGERLVQPHVFLLIGMRYRRLDRIIEGGAWRDAIANGQYILVRREAYEAIGGHEAVRGEVVEDLRFAQELARAGHRFAMREARTLFSTRMYTSLRDLVNGWTKNLAVGARQSSPRASGIVLAGILAFLAIAWILPAVVLGVEGVRWLGAGGGAPGPFLLWSGIVTGLSMLIWAGVHLRFGGSVAFSLIYPAGAAVVAFIVLRSWVRGTRRIEWKGRTYGDAASHEP